VSFVSITSGTATDCISEEDDDESEHYFDPYIIKKSLTPDVRGTINEEIIKI